MFKQIDNSYIENIDIIIIGRSHFCDSFSCNENLSMIDIEDDEQRDIFLLIASPTTLE